ncbi:olfactory receptor 2T27-like [Alligator mississippiensis]|uniref:olfactory receptor 2T27-like n=1 Tax=Alligator mississippiensis TaxID=8496 RepID=UPI0028773FC8|nr:olfactory receptor 2T27-like [Alligator mississippiensis]
MKNQPREVQVERQNATEFILLGLLNHSKVHMFFLALILLAFITAVSGNALLIFLIQVTPSLHTPMYFFLSQLAFMDICPSLFIIPKMSVDFLTPGNTISVAGCGTQVFLMLTIGGGECLLLPVMSYDRYVAICKPLQYPVLLSRRVCLALTAAVWISALINALIHTIYTMRLPYCDSKSIDHFFCEIPPLLKLSCSDTSTYETVVVLNSSILFLIPFSIILASYARIFATVLRMKSTTGQQKALATCSSHLTVVGLFFGAAMFTYMKPNADHSTRQDKIVPVFYSIITPVLNPVIYSLRNRDVLGALRKLVGKHRVLH